MKKVFFIILIIFLPVLLFWPVLSRAETAPNLERLLYYTDTDTGYVSLKKHASQIDILSPQAFTFDVNGTLSGGISDRAMNIVKAHPNMKLMPLVENAHFSTEIAHTILSNNAIQDSFISQLVAVGKQNGYWGWQLDMEHMVAADRPLFTAFAQKLGAALHSANLEYSIAVVAKVSDNPSDFSFQSWDGWAGAFDYAPLSQASDFLSVMLYDQDDSVGPASSLSWYQKVVAYATSVVPKEKLSIGIPFYAWEWKPNDDHKITSHTYQYVLNQIKARTVTSTTFNTVLGTGIMAYKVKINGTKQKRVLWYENVTSFGLKYGILENTGVRGFSGWALGQEDARDWTLLPARG